MPERDVPQIATLGDEVPAANVELLQPFVHVRQEIADTLLNEMAFIQINHLLAFATFAQANLAERDDIVHPVPVSVRVRAGLNDYRTPDLLFDRSGFSTELVFVGYILERAPAAFTEIRTARDGGAGKQVLVEGQSHELSSE